MKPATSITQIESELDGVLVEQHDEVILDSRVAYEQYIAPSYRVS